MLTPATATSTLTIRAVAAGLLVASALTAAAQRLWPTLAAQRHATPAAVAEDALVPLEDAAGEAATLAHVGDARFVGRLAAAGAVLVMAGVAIFAISPLAEPPGLPAGGLMRLDARNGAEAAWVDVGGVRVKQNLAGYKYEIADVRLGQLDRSSQDPATVKIRITHIPTSEVTEATLVAGGLTEVGGQVLSLVALEPNPVPAGIRATITDTRDARTFDAVLRVGQGLEDEKSRGSFVLETIEPEYMENMGVRAQGVVIEDDKEYAFVLWEKAPEYDAVHRAGRFHIVYKDLIPGFQAVLGVAEPPPVDLVPIAIALVLVGIGLVFAVPQRSWLAVHRDGQTQIAVSSINDAVGAVTAATRTRQEG